MANTKDLKLSPFPSILIIGDSGTHKTRFLGGVPGIYVVDTDRGMAINRDRSVEYDTFKDAPYGATFPTNIMKNEGIYPWGKAWTEFVKKMDQIGMLIDKGEGPKAIAIDSLTTLGNICMNYVLSESGSKGPPQIQHWGAQTQHLEVVMDRLSAWPIMFICTAHIQRDENKITEGGREYLPLTTGKFAGKVGIYFDDVWYTKAGKGTDGKRQFTIITESDSTYKQAKTRYNIPSGTILDWKNVEPFLKGKNG